MGILDGRAAIVTGAGRGIGRGEAIELARQGAAVVVNELDADAGAGVVKEIEAAGGHAVLDTGDVSDVAAADALIGRAIDAFGRLDALVNNAGILRDRTLVNMTPAEREDVIRVHLRGHYAPIHAACGYWKEQGRPGRIVCTASTSGLLGNFGQSNYGAAKGGRARWSASAFADRVGELFSAAGIPPESQQMMAQLRYRLGT